METARKAGNCNQIILSTCHTNFHSGLMKENDTESGSFSYRCWEEAIKGISNVLSDLRGTWYATDTKDRLAYQRERQSLEKYVTPFKYGVGAAAFLFFNFRITGNPRFQAWRNEMVAAWRRKMEQRPLEGKMPINGKSQFQSKHIHLPMGYLEAKRERDVKAAFASMRLITDVLVSFSVGTSGTLFLLNAKQDTLRRDFEESPLVTGRSVVADQMCEPFRNLFHDAKGMDMDPNTVTFSKFANNCNHRYNLEKQIRKTLCLSDNIPVTLPYLGLESDQNGR